MKISEYTQPLFNKKRNPDQPNIVFLMTDQQRFDTIAAIGNKWMKTPNMDRLVREGCSFTCHDPLPYLRSCSASPHHWPHISTYWNGCDAIQSYP